MESNPSASTHLIASPSQDAINALLALSDDQLSKIQFTLPSLVMAAPATDADGFSTSRPDSKEEISYNRQTLQQECWNKFNQNPQVNTSVRGVVGRITGMGFEATSGILKIQEVIEEIELDWRNRLYANWRPYVARAFVEGELFLIFTVHPDGFIEVDFMDPSCLGDTGDEGTGIIFHPRKTLLPIFYNISDASGTIVEQIPSIYVAHDPALVTSVEKHKDYDKVKQQGARDRKQCYKSIGGFKRFVVAWDKGFVTRRAISHLRTVLEWLNHYENLKKYEIDHKKASGAYVWAVSFEDVKAFRLWIGLPEADRKATALMQPVMPGSRLFLPPGMKIEAKSPNLPSLSNQDTDIMQMAISGLNEASDVTTGTVGGTYASVKATRGPMSDRTSDEIAYFDRFYRYDFWGAIFKLKTMVAGFPATFTVDEVVGFKDGEDIMGKRKYRPEQLVETSYPVSETIDLEGRVKAVLGVKHGALPDSIGLPQSRAAAWMGVGSYGRNRLRKATEDKMYPALQYSVDTDDADAMQEAESGETKKSENDDGDDGQPPAVKKPVKKPVVKKPVK